MRKERVLAEPPEGWPTGVGPSDVTVERCTPRGDTYAVDKVRVRGEVVGFVVGRPEVVTGRRWWDYALTPAEAGSPDVQAERLTYPTDRRQTAVGALIEARNR